MNDIGENRAQPLWVVKIGGSLEQAQELRPWLNVLAQAGAGRVVVVAGGGRFADAVREAQARWQFDDAAAHKMAILAMEQYGCLLAALEPRLAPAATLPAINQRLGEGRAVLWQPSLMTLADPDAGIPADWQMTSDSLAAWLAGRLGGPQLALVKSVAPPGVGVRCEQAIARGVVDARLRRILLDHQVSACWLGRSDHARFTAILDGSSRPLTPLLT